MEIYVTKYALSQGIYKTQATIKDGLAKVEPSKECESIAFPYYLHEGEYALTEHVARVQATKRRDKKIESLRKQLAAVEKMIF